MVMQVVMMPSQCVSRTTGLSPALSYLEKAKGVNYPPAPRQTPEENLIQLLAPKDLSNPTPKCLLGISCPSNVYSQLETIKGLSEKPWVDVGHIITHSFNELLRVYSERIQQGGRLGL